MAGAETGEGITLGGDSGLLHHGCGRRTHCQALRATVNELPRSVGAGYVVAGMQCPWCHAKLEPEDVDKRLCSKCDKTFEVGGPFRIKMLLAGLAVAGLAAYTYKTSDDGGLLGPVLLGLLATLLILRSRR